MNFEQPASEFVDTVLRSQAEYERSIQAAVLRLQAAVLEQIQALSSGEKPKEQPVPQSLKDIEKQPMGKWYAAQIFLND